MPKFRCVVATPIRELFSGDVYYANVPGVEGNFGVLSGHEQFAGLTRPGVLTLNLDEAGQEKVSFAVYEGITQMFNNHLSVLTQMGRAVDEIDVADAQRKLDEARAELAAIGEGDGGKADDAQSKTREDYIAWCEIQLGIAEGKVM